VLQQAARMLKEQKALVRSYNSDSFHEKLATGDVALAHGFNGQLAKVIKDAPRKLGFAVPREGGTFWTDNLAISANARNPEGAMQFINFVLEPANAARIAEEVGYGTPNAAAKKLLKPEIVSNEVIYPAAETLKRCKFMEDLGDAARLVNRQ
jgi:spermidine/putrescine transport system substrate-binding protein